jgi:hypothetical protein
MGNNPVLNFLAACALAVGIAAGSIFIAEKVHCWNFLGISKGCVISN